MRNQLLIVSALFCSILGFSQGIVFEHGTWKEVLEKAKQTSKPIFIDVYTSWCGPCKKMTKEIFLLEEVGKVYNTNFICYQIDAEKGEGVEIAKKYAVKAYPTYLFIKSDGVLYYTALGWMDAKKFIAESNNALSEINDTKPLFFWDKEYLQKKNDPKFLLDYILKRAKREVSNVVLFDEYLKLIPQEMRVSPTIVELYKNDGAELKVNSFAYKNLQTNSDKFVKMKFKYVYNILLDGVRNTMLEAAKSKNEQLLSTAILAFDQIPKNEINTYKEEIYIQYYKQTGETDKFVKTATKFCDDYLMKLNSDSIANKTKVSLQLFERQLNSGVYANMDSLQLAKTKTWYTYRVSDKIGISLNENAWDVFEKVSDKKVLQNALRWSKRSLEIYPNSPLWLDTYANLLYKLGQKEEAIAKEEEALRFARKEDTEGFEKTIMKMKADEKTWKQE
jgi:thiol-disulfide isomerase/thioredoxin